MARPKAKAPARRYHLSGQSVVTIGGRDFYLGPHDSPESIARYAVLIGIYQANGLTMPDDFDLASLDVQAAALLGQLSPQVAASDQTKQPKLVRHVTAAFREFVRIRYANEPKESGRQKLICDDLDRHDGNTDATDYGPLALQRQRQRWIDKGNSRVYVNRLTRSAVRMFRYAVNQELIEETTWRRLLSVESLRNGQTEAPETAPRVAANLDHVRRTAAELSPVIKAMIRIQVATGMRPSELCQMRPCEIDRSGETWVYRPKKHKTAKLGKLKAVPLIGDAREAITDYLNRDPQAPCFSMKESVAWQNARKRADRKTKVQPSQVNRAKLDPKKQPGDCLNPASYRQSIKLAAKRAGVPHWVPYQLRHLAGATVREALGIEAASALLGHSRTSMTELYAPQSEAKAIEAAKVAPTL